MIKNIILLGFVSLLLFSCNSKNNVEIKGTIKDADKQSIYLEQVNVDNVIIVDSVKTNKNGDFKFKTAVKLPTFYNIRLGNNELVTIVAEPDEKIEISGTLKDLKNNYWVDGSENSLWIKLLNFQLNNTRVAMDSLRKSYMAAPQGAEYDTKRQELAVAWDSVFNKQLNFSQDFILKHAVSPASYYALYQKFDNNNFILTPDEHLQSYKIVASSLKAMYPESQYTLAILKHLDQINKNLQNLKLKQFIANSESNLPEISLPDASGDTISFSSLKGKYIILDFTVLSANGSRQYINELKEIYNKYKGKNVEIYQVCLDENRTLWENLVRQYGITWKCVLDSDGLRSRVAQTWNVTKVPADYIINKKSEIVGKNLYGRRLEERLNDIMK